jgi:hypothetical protein
MTLTLNRVLNSVVNGARRLSRRQSLPHPARSIESRPLRIAFMTTVGRNVGDEFIREGIRSCLDDIGRDYLPFYVDKSDLTTLHRWQLDEQEALGDKFREADLIIHAGAPAFWHLGVSTCYNESWVKQLWEDRIFKLAPQKRVFNLGIGTCQPREDDSATLLNDPQCVEFIRRVVNSARLTTVRDRLTSQIFESLGLHAELLPCPAFLAARRVNGGIAKPPRDVLAVNLMELGGHYLLKSEYDPKRWSDVILQTLPQLRKNHRLLFVAHNEAEVRFLRYCNQPDEEIFHSKDYRDYLTLYSEVAGIVSNRVHGAVCVAGFGRPAVLVGTDSRIGVARPIGIPAIDACEVTSDWIVQSLQQQMDHRDTVMAERIQRRESVASAYIRLLREQFEIGQELP